MQTKPSETAAKFWTTRNAYPPYDHVERRRWADLQYLVPIVGHTEALVDLGAGDGGLSHMLNRVTEIQRFYLYDISKPLLEHAHEWWGVDNVVIRPGDLFGGRKKFQPAGYTICMGLLCYCFDDGEAFRFMQRIQSPNVIVRVPCAGFDRIVVNKHSKAMNDDYAAVYRTVGEYHKILSATHEILSMKRSWPDEIESKFGTRQFTFQLKKKN